MVFKLVATGDTTYYPHIGKQREVSNQVMAIKPDQVVLLGDISQGRGSESSYKNWFDPSYGRIFNTSINLTGVPGNHDRGADRHSRPFRKRFLGNTNLNNPTYFDQNLNRSWKLIALDDNPLYVKEQNVWLRQRLRANRNSSRPRQVIIAWHAPRFTYGRTSIKNSTRAEQWWNVIHDDPYTRILLHGHQHSYRHAVTRKGYLRDIFICGTGGGETQPQKKPWAYYGVLLLTLYDPGGYKVEYRQIIKNRNQRIGGATGKVTRDVVRRGPRRLKVVDGGGSGQTPDPGGPVTVPDVIPVPDPPEASDPTNPPPPPPPPASIRPPQPPKDPTKREAYVEDDVLYIWWGEGG